MSTGIILASHGEFAIAALGSAEMIVGKQENVIALALTIDKSLEQLEKEVEQAYQVLSTKCDVIIALCDIYGGSPFNAISRCLLKGMDMVAFTGLSLPILIDLLLSREITKDDVEKRIISTHQQAVIPIKVKLVEDNDDECDL